MEIERAFQIEIDNKQREIDDQKDRIQLLREQHEVKSLAAREELDEVRQRMDKKHDDTKYKIKNQMENLFESKWRQNKDIEDSAELEKEKEELARFMEGEWQKISQYEVKLADIELKKRKTILQWEVKQAREEELHAWERDEELKDLEERQIKLLEVQEILQTDKARADNRSTLEKVLADDLKELDELDKKIKLLEEKRDDYIGSEEGLTEIAEEINESFEGKGDDYPVALKSTRRLSDITATSTSLAIDTPLRKSSLNFEPNRSSYSPDEKGEELAHQLQRLMFLKKEKLRIVDETRGTLADEVTNVEFYGRQILENEAKITELEEQYKSCRQKHAEKIRLCLENLKSKEEDDVNVIGQEREKYIDLLWKEYSEIENLMAETFESLNSSCLSPESDAGDIDDQKQVLNAVQVRLQQIGSDKDDLFLEYVAKRARFEKDEDRVHEQQKKISEQTIEGIKEKEIALQRLYGQRERFHVERARERRLIRSRIKRLYRLKSSDDLQNEEMVEFFKEEASKLREAFEKVEETENRY